MMLWYILYTRPVTLPADLQATEKHVRSQEKDIILMRKCSSCLIISASSIIGKGSKNGVLGGDKQKFITIIWGGASPFPKIHPSQSKCCFCAQRIASSHARSVNSHFSALFTVRAHGEYNYRNEKFTLNYCPFFCKCVSLHFRQITCICTSERCPAVSQFQCILRQAATCFENCCFVTGI